MRLKWSQRAVTDVEHLRTYIAQDSPFYAYRFTEQLLAAVERLEQFPASGRMVPEMHSDNLREVIYQGYRIIYRVRDDCVEIATVVHCSRDLSNPTWQPHD